MKNENSQSLNTMLATKPEWLERDKFGLDIVEPVFEISSEKKLHK